MTKRILLSILLLALPTLAQKPVTKIDIDKGTQGQLPASRVSGGGTGGGSKNAISDATLYVSLAGDNANDGLSWPSAKKTLGAAVASCIAIVNNHGCVIWDNAPELFTVNPFAGTYGSGTTTKSVEVHLGPGVWTTNVNILLGHNQQLIGAGRTNNSVPCGTSSVGTCIQAGPSFPSSTPIIKLGDATLTGWTFASRLENLHIDCKDAAGSVGILATGTNEQSGARRTMVTSCKDAGIRLATGQNAHTIWNDIEIYPSNTGASAIGVDIQTGVAGAGDWDSVTIVYPGTAGTAAFKLNNAQEMSSRGLHIENATDGVLFTSTTLNQGLTFLNTSGNSNVTNLFHNTGINGGVSILGWSTLGGTRAILDDLNGVSITDAYGSSYAWDMNNKQVSNTGGTMTVPTLNASTVAVGATVTVPAGFALVGAGDSRLAGSGLLAGEDLLTRISQQPQFAGFGSMHNGAVGGESCATMTTHYATNVLPFKAVGKPSYLFVLDQFNDTVISGLTLAALETCYQSYVSQAVTDGFTPVLITSYFAGSVTPAQDIIRQQFNDWLRGLPYAVMDADMVLPPQQNGINIYLSPWYKDTIHLNAAGVVYLAKAINNMWGAAKSGSMMARMTDQEYFNPVSGTAAYAGIHRFVGVLDVDGSMNAFGTSIFNGLTYTNTLWANTTGWADGVSGNFGSSPIGWRGNYWNGSAGLTDAWFFSTVVGTGITPTSSLTLTHSGSSGAAKLDLTDVSISAVMLNGGGANKATCFKADAKTIGYCSTVIDAAGACTCN